MSVFWQSRIEVSRFEHFTICASIDLFKISSSISMQNRIVFNLIKEILIAFSTESMHFLSIKLFFILHFLSIFFSNLTESCLCWLTQTPPCLVIASKYNPQVIESPILSDHNFDGGVMCLLTHLVLYQLLCQFAKSKARISLGELSISQHGSIPWVITSWCVSFTLSQFTFLHPFCLPLSCTRLLLIITHKSSQLAWPSA